MRLYLDDIRPMPTDFDIKVTTGEQCISILQNLIITHLSFDHDLGEDILTGYDVAKQIEEWAYEGKIAKLTWEIHSANPVGRKNIKAAMEKADYYWNSKKCSKCKTVLTTEDTSYKCNTCLAEKCL